MYLEINKNLELTILEPADMEAFYGQRKVRIFGKLAGLYLSGKIIDGQGAFSHFKKAIFEGGDLESLLTQSIGAFNLVISSPDKIKIYASPYGPGSFFARKQGKLIFLDREKDFYKKIKEKGLNDFEVLHNLLNHPAMRSPFTTIFKETNRMVGGQVLEIKGGLAVRQRFYLPYHTYCGKKRSLKELYPKFKNLWEDSVGHAYDFYKTDNNFVLLSGGIDSTIEVLAAKQKELDVRILHYRKSFHLSHSVNIFAKKVGWPVEFIGAYLSENSQAWWQPYINRSKEVYRSALGMLGMENLFLYPVFKKGSMFLSTHSIGMLYQGNPFSVPNFSRSYGKQWIRDWKMLKPKRFLFSEMWRTIVAEKPWAIPLFNFLADKKHRHPANSFQYLYSLLFYKKMPLMVDSILPPELSSLENDYRAYKERVILEPVLGKEMHQDLKSGKKIDGRTLGQLMRLLKFSITTQSATLGMTNYGQATGARLVDPPMHGPMIDFLHKMPITLREVNRLKTMYFMYFKDILGIDYFKDYLPECSQKKFLPEVWQRIKGGRVEQPVRSKHDIILDSPQFREHFLPEINPKDSVLLQTVSNPAIKDYILNLYQQIQAGKYPAFYTVNQILNLELFLKDIL